jgi:hypothetical protein
VAIRSFPSSKKLSGSNLREFRSYVSQLKKQGVLPAKLKTGTVRPYNKVGGRTLADWVNQNHRRLTEVKSSPKTNPKLHSENKPTLAQAPFHIRDFATNQKDLAVLFRDIERDRELSARIDAKKRPDERWAMRIDGTDSLNIYASIDLMIDDLFKYSGHGLSGPYGTRDIFHDKKKAQALLPKLQLIRWNRGIGEWTKTRKFPKHKKATKKTKKKSHKKRTKK